jgi:hypothetical protein
MASICPYLLPRPGPLARDQRGVEAAVLDLPGQVADGRVTYLGGRHELLDDLPVAVTGALGQRLGVAQPPPQQLRHHGDVHGCPAVREENLVQGGLQPG